jgi:hypothetical protein
VKKLQYFPSRLAHNKIFTSHICGMMALKLNQYQSAYMKDLVDAFDV